MKKWHFPSYISDSKSWQFPFYTTFSYFHSALYLGNCHIFWDSAFKIEAAADTFVNYKKQLFWAIFVNFSEQQAAARCHICELKEAAGDLTTPASLRLFRELHYYLLQNYRRQSGYNCPVPSCRKVTFHLCTFLGTGTVYSASTFQRNTFFAPVRLFTRLSST